MAARQPGIVRKLFATDLSLFRDHLLRLDVETRHDRFGSAVNDTFLERYAARCFATGAVVHAYLENGVIRGAAELHPIDGAEPDTAEAAFSVEPDFRRRGLGAELFKRLLVSARNRGVLRLRMNCLAHNEAMRALARRFGVPLVFERWQVVGSLKPMTPTPLSWLTECEDDARGFMTAALGVVRSSLTEASRV